MRKKLVVGNWKMNLTQAQAVSATETLLQRLHPRQDVEVAVCPPYLSIPKVREVLRRSSVMLGAQDVFWKDSGAFTGRVSAHMLADAGVTMCIVGHSETRGRFGKLEIAEDTICHFAESDQTVNLKIKALLYHNITPILCVGETHAERKAGETDAIIRAQLAGALEGVEAAEYRGAVVAYEPVWAIGTGETCVTAEASRVCAGIREQLGELLDEEAAEHIRVLYGGSVKSSNSGELFRQENIDGGLVGGASLDPDEFSRIVLSAPA